MTNYRYLRWLSGMILGAALTAAAPAPGQDKKEDLPPPQPRPAEFKVLDRFVGSWNTEVISKPAEWTPKEGRSIGSTVSEWTLEKQFLRTDGKSKEGKGEALQMMTYHPEHKEFFMWFFDSAGIVSVASGQWDAAAEVLIWKSEIDDNVSSVNRVHFVNKDTIEWTLIAKDKKNKVYLNMVGKITRKKKAE